MMEQPFTIERTFNTSIENAWSALTDKEQMKAWYFNIPEFKPEVGFEFTFDGGNEGRKYVHLCEITEVVVNKKLGHTWRYKGYDGVSYVLFELFAEEAGTRVKLTHEGLETLPQSNPDFKKENFSAGWNHIIGTSLKDFLQKPS
jgi:uncharacterized protein YndB with AHSA1/START domain